MSNVSEKPARVHMWVSGRVQGVSFRAFVQRQAIEIGVTGWVRNVGYNQVEAIAEGGEDKIKQFVQMMKRGPIGSRVDDWNEEWEVVMGEFQGFVIKASVGSF